MSFADADANDDGVIEYDEFVAAMPAKVREKHTEEQMRSWFAMLDRDKGGKISRDEHLRWALNAAALTTGAHITEVFSRYDRDGSGQLSELEFCRAARDVKAIFFFLFFFRI